MVQKYASNYIQAMLLNEYADNCMLGFLHFLTKTVYYADLTALHDLLTPSEYTDFSNSNTTDATCNKIGTGTLLAASEFPSMLLIFLPFLGVVPFKSVVLLTGIIHFICTFGLAFNNSLYVSFIFVVVVAFFARFVFVCILGVSSQLTANASSYALAGAGLSHLSGSVIYATLRQFGLQRRDVFMVYSLFPFTLFLIGIFWVRKNEKIAIVELTPLTEKNSSTIVELLQRYFWKIYIVMAIGSFLDYVVSYALFELSTAKSDYFTAAEQIRWFVSLYQIGIVISRFSNIILAKYLYSFRYMFLLVLSCSFTLFSIQANFHLIISVPIIMGLAFCHGLTAGSLEPLCAYSMYVLAENSKAKAMMLIAIFEIACQVIAGLIGIAFHASLCP